MLGDDDIPSPITSVRTGGYKPGDEVSMYGRSFRVSKIDEQGRPQLELKEDKSPVNHQSPGKVKPWNEIAQSFDPLMPEDHYNTLKKVYFDRFVAPQIPEGFSHSATWKQFDEATVRDITRPGLFGGHVASEGEKILDRAEGPMMEASEGYIRQLLRPMKGVGGQPEKVYDYLTKLFDNAHKYRAAIGADHPALGGLGEMTGVAVNFAGVGKGVGAASAANIIPAAEDLALSGRAAEMFDRVMRGGTTFAAYEAAVANKDEKGTAALKGFAMGAGFEGAFTLAGKLLKKGVEMKTVQKLLQQALTPGTGQVSPELDDIIAESVVNDVKTARQEGRSSFVNSDSTLKTSQVQLRTHKGEEVFIPLEEGKEKDALNKVGFHVQQGGEVLGISHPPGQEGLVNKFLRMQEQEHEGKYAERVVKTVPGGAEAIAADMGLEGVKAEPVGADTIRISTPKLTPTRDQVKEQLARSGIGEPELTNTAAQVMQLWNKALPQKSGETMLETLKVKLGAEQLNPLLPDHWKVPEQSIKTIIAQKTPQVEEALGELGADPADVGESRKDKISRLFGLLDLPSGNRYIQMQAEDIMGELGITDMDPEDLSSMGFKNSAEMEKFLSSHQIGQELEEEVLQKSKDITAPGAMEEAVRKGEVAPSAIKPNTWGGMVDLRDGTIEETYTYEQAGGGKSHTTYMSPEQQLKMKEGESTFFFIKDGRIVGEFPQEFEQKIKDQLKMGKQASDIVPPTEAARLGFTAAGQRMISSTPSRIGIKMSQEELEQIHPGAAALTVFPGKAYDEILHKFGVFEIGDQRPLHLYTSTWRDNVWHENLHVGLEHASNFEKTGEDGLYARWRGVGTEETGRTAFQIASRLATFEAYKPLSIWSNIEEAFVHASTAIRMGDAEKLGELAAWDTSVRHVMDMVEDFGVKAVDLSKEQADTYPQRIFQRAMNNVIAKASQAQKWEISRVMDTLNQDMFYDPVKRGWVVIGGQGEKLYTSIPQVIDDLEKQMGESFAPSMSLPLEMRGVRGPFTPRGGGPSKNLPLPEGPVPRERMNQGLKAVTGAFRPMIPWVADVHTEMNEFFSTKGQYFPLYEKVKAVDEAMQAADNYIISQKEEAAQFLKGNPKKLYDYMDVLTAEQKFWPDMQVKYKLSADDMLNLGKAEEWLRGFQADTHIPAFNYLREQLPRLRQLNFNTERMYGGRATEAADMSFFHRAITEGSLDPKDAHLGRFINFLIREGTEKKFTGGPINDLKKLVDLKGKEGDYVLGAMRWPLSNYVNYVRGIPDATQQILMRATGDFQQGLAVQFKRLNKYLPDWAKLPEEFSYPGQLVNRLMTLSYVGSLGARPAIALRDLMQAFTTSLPVLGIRFARYGHYGLTREGLDLARESGALLTKTNIGEMYQDIFTELPAGGNMMDKATKVANQLLAPSRWGHNGARNLAFNVEYHSTLDAVQKYRAGMIDAHSLLTDTSMWWYDEPAMGRLLQMAGDHSVPAEEVAKLSGRELVDTTLWPYRRGAQPALLRTGMGRIFGQFGMWPMNYVDFLRRGVSKFHRFPAQSLRTAATWAGTNYAAVAAMNSMGADVGKWFFTSPAGYGGGPALELVQNLAKSPENTDEGRQARQRVLEYPFNFLPAFNEMKSVYGAVNDGGPMFNDDGTPSPNFLKVLGFRPINELKEEHLNNLTPEERLEYELGYKKVR